MNTRDMLHGLETRTARLRVALLVVACGLAFAACAPQQKGYEIRTGEIDCEEANRLVLSAVNDMRMTVTGLKPAKPGSPGYITATRTEKRGKMDGKVTIDCKPDGVEIIANQQGLSGDEFERGIFLSVIGRADLMVERDGRGIGKIVRRDGTSSSSAGSAGSSGSSGGSTGGGSSSSASSGSSAGSSSSGSRARSEPKVVGVQALLTPIRGYATLLDFEANLTEAGILPVKVRITNGTRRTLEFDPADVVLRKAGSRDRAKPLSASQALERLKAANLDALNKSGAQASSGTGPGDPLAPSSLGDVGRAGSIMRDRRLRPARLRAGDVVEGFLFFEEAPYDRARVLMIDSATGETEGFLVEF